MNHFFNGRANKKIQVILLSTLLVVGLLTSFQARASDSSYKDPIEVTRNEEEGTLTVRTELADYLFSLTGGNLRSIFLYFSSFRTNKAEIIPGTTIDPETMETSFMEGARFPGELDIGGESDKEVQYEASVPDGVHRDELSITLTGEHKGMAVEKTYTLYNDPNYTFGVNIKINNESGEAVNLSEGTVMYLGTRTKPPESDNVDYLSNPTTKYIFDGEVSNGKLATGSYNQFNATGFVGDDLVLFLKMGNPYESLEEPHGQGTAPYTANQSVGVNLFQDTLGSGETREFQFSIYGGRRRHVLLSNVGLAEIDETGFFSKVLVPVIQFLNQLYRLTGNYAWAIILFTVLIRVLLYPLMRNMYRSMAKMQELQPKIKKIQDKYDDKEKQQKKMMALYKEEDVNPMGGCLPMFIQLPILILLWRAIMYSAEAIHLSPGFLWMNDLSLADPYYILVVLTVATMIIQQQMMSPAGGGSQNKIMSYGFPLFMGIFLRDFPAGLWLYYFLTQIFMIGQQAFINWEMEQAEAKKEAKEAG
ncbi:MAG: YidC/Oxa1 family insertase periplasmic-domain containing protein [Candidatus Acetothermia bacterium]